MGIRIAELSSASIRPVAGVVSRESQLKIVDASVARQAQIRIVSVDLRGSALRSASARAARLNLVRPFTQEIAVPAGGVEIVIYNSGVEVDPGIFYLLPWGITATREKADTPMPDGQAAELRVEATLAPGSGKSFYYQVLKNGSPTGLEVTISDTETIDGAEAAISYTAGDKLAVRVTASSGAALAWHKASLRFVPS